MGDIRQRILTKNQSTNLRGLLTGGRWLLSFCSQGPREFSSCSEVRKALLRVTRQKRKTNLAPVLCSAEFDLTSFVLDWRVYAMLVHLHVKNDGRAFIKSRLKLNFSEALLSFILFIEWSFILLVVWLLYVGYCMALAPKLYFCKFTGLSLLQPAYSLPYSVE
jgi:hypothetical protein